VADRKKVEHGRRQRKTGESDKYDGDHGIADEVHVTPQRRHYDLSVHGLLPLQMSQLQDTSDVPAATQSVCNFYVK
jgi:hypothetical protein